MNSDVREALDYCRQIGLSSVVLGIPFALDHEDVKAIKDANIVKGMTLYHPPPEVTANSSHKWLGSFTEDGDWSLPATKGAMVFVGTHLMLTRRMAMRVWRSRRFVIVCKFRGAYRPLAIYRFLLWFVGARIHHKIDQLPHGSVLRRYLFSIAEVPVFRRIWGRVFKRESITHGHAPTRTGLVGDSLYRELFRRALERPENETIDPVPGRVLLVNAGLAAGGAERQIVNTLIGLRNSGKVESVGLLAEYIEHAPNLDFFLPELESQGIRVAQVQRAITLAEDGLSSLPLSIAEVVADLPETLIEEILNLIAEFRARRPSVVHAWQDSTSIKAGIAAVIAGVPRIVLASRNVAPTNFAYFQDYMRPAYRALATLESVTFLNNSEAGATDYTKWLDLSPERFVVLRNGVDLTGLRRAPPSEVVAYRNTLQIPDGAPVVGSVFRFWPEKRPMLWLEIAHEIAKARPEVHFLLIGEGPMRVEMEAFVRSCGLANNVHLPGSRPDVALPLSAMNTFLLTSEFEGTPNVVLEAQWLGLPVVATDSGGTRESFSRGVTGELAETADPRDIAPLVLHFLSAPHAQARAAETAPRFVADRFGPNRMVRETLMLYGREMSDNTHARCHTEIAVSENE